MTELEVIAYHEAGHAVAYIATGVRFVSASATSDDCVVIPDRTRPGRDFFALALRCLAGPVAEARFTGLPLAEIFAGPGRTALEALY